MNKKQTQNKYLQELRMQEKEYKKMRKDQDNKINFRHHSPIIKKDNLGSPGEYDYKAIQNLNHTIDLIDPKNMITPEYLLNGSKHLTRNQFGFGRRHKDAIPFAIKNSYQLGSIVNGEPPAVLKYKSELTSENQISNRSNRHNGLDNIRVRTNDDNSQSLNRQVNRSIQDMT